MNKKSITGIVIGSLLVVAGVCILGQLSGIWDLSQFMNGWWTLFLIVPAVASMIVKGPRAGNVMLLLLGAWLFAECQGWLGGLDWQFLGGVFLIFLGVRALTGWGRRDREHPHRHRHRDCPEVDAGAEQSK